MINNNLNIFFEQLENFKVSKILYEYYLIISINSAKVSVILNNLFFTEFNTLRQKKNEKNVWLLKKNMEINFRVRSFNPFSMGNVQQQHHLWKRY